MVLGTIGGAPGVRRCNPLLLFIILAALSAARILVPRTAIYFFCPTPPKKKKKRNISRAGGFALLLCKPPSKTCRRHRQQLERAKHNESDGGVARPSSQRVRSLVRRTDSRSRVAPTEDHPDAATSSAAASPPARTFSKEQQ